MFHAQPASALLLNPAPQARVPDQDGPGLLLNVLIVMRDRRRPTDEALEPAASAAPTASVSLPAHAGGQSARVRSGLGGRLQQTRRGRGSPALRRRGHIHLPRRRANRRGL